jgi:hypothetical protein
MAGGCGQNYRIHTFWIEDDQLVIGFSKFPAEHRMRSLLIVFLLYVGLVGWANADEPKDVSMIELIANPQRFDGKAIRILLDSCIWSLKGMPFIFIVRTSRSRYFKIAFGST